MSIPGNRRGLRILGALGLIVLALPLASPVRAQDFFSRLFGGFIAQPPPPIRAPFDDGTFGRRQAPRPRATSAEGQAYCVRTCDGRYFPIAAISDEGGRAKLCKSLCPASETRVVYGEDIDDAVTEVGKSYSDLPNAFRYRNELVAGCTCNGKDHFGLAQIRIEDDPTLRSGDIVAGPQGLVVASRSGDRRGLALNFSPIPKKMRGRFRDIPVLARE